MAYEQWGGQQQPDYPQGRTVTLAENEEVRRKHGTAYKVGKVALITGVAASLFTSGVATGVYGFSKVAGVFDHYLPVPVPNVSKLHAKELKISPEFKECYTAATFDVGSAAVRTKFRIMNWQDVSGYGAAIKAAQVYSSGPKKGQPIVPPQVAKEYCLNGADIVTKKIQKDGRTINDVRIPVGSIKPEVKFVEDTVTVTEADPPSTRILGGAIDITSGFTEGGCDNVAKISFGKLTPKDCRILAALSNWKANGQAQLQTGLRLATLDYVARQCTETGWEQGDRAAFVDGVVEEAVKQGFTPEDEQVTFVDAQGNPTKQQPVPAATTWQRKYDSDFGVFGQSLPQTPTVEFQQASCAPLIHPYQSQYPNVLNPANR